MVTEPFAPIRPHRGLRLIIAGVIIAAAALIFGVMSGVVVSMSVGGPLSEALTSPSRPTPVDDQLSLKAGRYTVFELVGQRSSQGPITTTRRTGATVTPGMIDVISPKGDKITAYALSPNSSESLTRDHDIYAGVARFVVAEPGRYHVLIDSPPGKQVVIAPSFGSGFSAVLGWLLAGITSFVALVFGVILIVVGTIRRARPAVRPTEVTGPSGQYSGQPFRDSGTRGHNTGPPDGWYPAPDVPNRQRYWDGRAWTDQLR